MTELVIRQARPEDDAALAELFRTAWSGTSEITPRPAPGEPFFHEGSRPEHYLVAALDKRLVAYLRLVQPIPVDSVAHVRQIQGLAVDASVRRRGIASALVQAAMAESHRAGATRLTLRVLATNDPAIALYEKLGFHLEGRLQDEFKLDGRYVDDLLMARRLS